MAKSNAERQKAYRQRQAGKRNGPVTVPDRAHAGVTRECPRHIYICRGVNEDIYARVMHTAPCRAGICPPCDEERQWYRDRGQDQTSDGFAV